MDATALLVSIFALVVSIGAFILSITSYKRDNPKLRVSLDYWPQGEREMACFNVRVINHGRRIARVERIAIYFQHGNPLRDSIAGGQPVNESEPFDYQLPIFDMDGNPTHIPSEVKFVEVFDTLHKRYKYPDLSLPQLLEFRNLKAKIREEWRKIQIS